MSNTFSPTCLAPEYVFVIDAVTDAPRIVVRINSTDAQIVLDTCEVTAVNDRYARVRWGKRDEQQATLRAAVIGRVAFAIAA